MPVASLYTPAFLYGRGRSGYLHEATIVRNKRRYQISDVTQLSESRGRFRKILKGRKSGLAVTSALACPFSSAPQLSQKRPLGVFQSSKRPSSCATMAPTRTRARAGQISRRA